MMKRKLILGSISTALILLAPQPPALALGVFDKLKKKAAEIVKDEAGEKAKEAMGLGEEEKAAAPSSTSIAAGSDSTPKVKISSGNQPTTARKMARAVLSIAPAILDTRPDYQLKLLVKIFYPEETSKLSNEFYWRKNKKVFKGKMLKESAGAPTSFEVAPWIDNRSYPEGTHNNYSNNLELRVGRYNFEKEAWPVYVPMGDKWILPWLSNYREPVGYQIPVVKKATTYWLPMSADKAEKLNQTFQGSNRLYGHYRFTVSDIIGVHVEDHPGYEQHKKYMKGQYKSKVIGKLTPLGQISIEGNKIDLFVKKVMKNTSNKDDYRFVATLKLTP